MGEGGQFISSLIRAVCTVKPTQCKLHRATKEGELFTRSTPPNNGQSYSMQFKCALVK